MEILKMDLKTYLTKHNVRQKEFAEKLNITEGMMSYILNGQRKIKPQLALDIEKETKGLIKADSLIFDEYRSSAD